MEKPTLRILHNMARSGGTLICKCLGCMDSVTLLSEIHPAGTRLFNPLAQAHDWFNLLSDDDTAVLTGQGTVNFTDAILLIHRRCNEINKSLVVRDWSHIDFTAVPFVPRPTYRLTTAEVLSRHFSVINTASVRHPIDQWLSLRRLDLIRGKLTLAEYLKGYCAFARHCRSIGFIRYEDFVVSAESALMTLCARLHIKYDAAFKEKWYDYTTITGEVQGGRAGESIKPVPRRPVEDGLMKDFTNDDNYWESLELLGYRHPS